MAKKKPKPRNRSRRIASGARGLAEGPYDRDLAEGRYDRALADFDRAIELDPTDNESVAARTEIRQLTGRSDTDV